jgi:hypothetical protein
VNSETLDRPSAARSDVMTGWGFATVVYVATTLLYFAVPISGSFGEKLLGTSQWSPDNTLNAAILEWGARAVSSRSAVLFDWPPGYPVHNTLAGTEVLVGWQLLFLPQRLLGVSIVAAYNVCFLFSFIVSGLAANLLARRYGVAPAGALIAGFVFAFAPQHVGQAVQFQSLAICWLPLGIVAFERAVSERGIGVIVLLAAIVVITVLSSLYYGVFLVIILGAWYVVGLVTGWFPRSFRGATRVAAAAAMAVVVLLPFIVTYVRMSSSFGYDRSIQYAIERSAQLSAFLYVPRWLLLWGDSRLHERPGSGAGFPGLVLLLLLLASIRWNAPAPRKRSILALAVFCAVLSLGPRLKVFNYPTSFLINVPMPGSLLGFIPGIRAPSRLLPCAFVFLSVLAGGGAAAVLARWPRKQRLFLSALLVLAALDVYPAPWFASASRRLPPPLATSAAYAYVAASSDSTPLVEWPAADSTGFALPAKAYYVYGSIGHLHRVVSYSLSLELPAADSLQSQADQLPGESARQALVARGIHRLILHRRFASTDSVASRVARLDNSGFRALFRGRDAIVYSLEPPSVPATNGASRSGAR